MENQLFANITDPEERARYLADNCDRVEDVTYLRSFDPDEMVQFKEELSEVSVAIDNLEVEKKVVVANYTADLKPQKERRKEILKALREKAVQVTERCYTFFDHDRKRVLFYNDKGLLVNSRAMRPQEMSHTVFSSIRNPAESERTGTTG